MMRLGIRPMRGKIGSHRIDMPYKIGFDTIDPFCQRVFDPVNLLTQHLVPFNDNIQLVLKIFGHDADLMLEHLLDFLEISSFHDNSPLCVFRLNNAHSTRIPPSVKKKPPPGRPERGFPPLPSVVEGRGEGASMHADLIASITPSVLVRISLFQNLKTVKP